MGAVHVFGRPEVQEARFQRDTLCPSVSLASTSLDHGRPPMRRSCLRCSGATGSFPNQVAGLARARDAAEQAASKGGQHGSMQKRLLRVDDVQVRVEVPN